MQRGQVADDAIGRAYRCRDRHGDGTLFAIGDHALHPIEIVLAAIERRRRKSVLWTTDYRLAQGDDLADLCRSIARHFTRHKTIKAPVTADCVRSRMAAWERHDDLLKVDCDRRR